MTNPTPPDQHTRAYTLRVNTMSAVADFRTPAYKRHPKDRAARKLNDTVSYTADGDPITVGHLIVTYVLAGNFLDVAAHAAGVDPPIVRGWLRTGADIHQRRRRGEDGRRYSANQRRCERFALAITEALATAEARGVHLLDQLATGPVTRKTTRKWIETTDPDTGETIRTGEVAVTEQVIHHPPDARVLMWRQQIRWPANWKPRADLTDTDPDDPIAPAEDPLDDFDRQLTAIVDRKAESTKALLEAGVDVNATPAGRGPVVIDVEPHAGPDDTPL